MQESKGVWVLCKMLKLQQNLENSNVDFSKFSLIQKKSAENRTNPWSSLKHNILCFGCIKETSPDPEGFVREAPTLTTFFFSFWFMRGSKIPLYYERAIIGPPAKRHFNGVSLACRWWPYYACWLGSLWFFRESGPVLLRDPIFFVIFQGGGVRTPCPPLDPHMNKKVNF